jgi:hypothetical protein
VGRGQTRLAARSGFDNAPVRRWGKLHIYVHTHHWSQQCCAHWCLMCLA